MSLKERIIAYLKRQDRQITQDEILYQTEPAGYSKWDTVNTLRELENIAHIGQWWDSKDRTMYYRWYKPNEVTDKVQECLDRGEDW